MRQIFVSVAGQHDNLGDVVLRRCLLHSLRALGDLHLLVYNADAPYLAATVDRADRIYTSIADWRGALHAAAAAGSVLYVHKPGELLLSWRQLARELADRRLLRRIRRRSGASFLLGVGARRSPDRWQRLALRYAYAPFAITAWRDARTQRDLRFGEVMPDWAFGDGTPGDQQVDTLRDRLVVSLRSDRPEPSAEWIAAIREFAARRAMRITVVCQVGRDLERCRMLADALGGDVAPWLAADLPATERALRTIYRETALMVSDRLHVLIIAASEGAVPLCLLDRAEHKVARHFDAIGYHGSAEVVTGPDVEARIARLEHHAGRRGELVAACDAARVAVRDIEHRIAMIGGR